MLASAGQREERYANCSEYALGEVRIIPVPRTSVHKGKKEGRSC
jgi:hypothetical protein